MDHFWNNPMEGEVLAVIFGLQLSGEAFFTNLEVKFNCLQLILNLEKSFSSLFLAIAFWKIFWS